MIDILRGMVGILVMFGIAIFVHELGHFMFAKLFGVRVETFSLGFGKKIIKKQWGETEYCISIIPFGGYVKMVGTYSKELEALAEGDVPARPDEKEAAKEVIHELEAPAPPTASATIVNEVEALRSKPYWQQLIVLAAGCAMNILMGFFVYFCLLWFGHHQAPDMPVVIGKVNTEILPTEPVLREGDTILKLNDETIESSQELAGRYALLYEADPSATMSITLLRDNTTQTIVMPVESPFQPAIPPAQVTAIGGEPTHDEDDRFGRINTLIQDPTTTQVYISYVDDAEITREVLAAPLAAAGSSWFELVYPVHSPAYIQVVLPNLPGDKAGLRAGDEIKTIDGVTINSPLRAIQVIQERGGKTVEFVVTRIVDEKPTEVTIPVPVRIDPKSKIERGQIGVHFGPGRPTEFVSYPFGESVKMAFFQVVDIIPRYLKGMKRIITSGFQTFRENVAGPVGIAQQAYTASQSGITNYLFLFAAFNIILAITNLLPLPVLDGGHIFFLTIEKIIRRPLPATFMQFVYQIFIFLLLGLALLITFNDVIMNLWRIF